MSDLTKMKVQELRALARKVLGSGAWRLKRKADLVRALEEAQGRVSAATSDLAQAARDAAIAAGEKGLAPGGATSAARRTTEGSTRAPTSAAAGRPREDHGPARSGSGPLAGSESAPPASGADPEGFFVARVRGAEEAREGLHPMVEGESGAGRERTAGGGEPPREDLGDLPPGYGDDAFVAIPRDPRTLFLYWDHSRETIADAFAGLDGARAQLWVFARAGGRWERVRAVDLAFDSRAYYMHDLEPGRTYRAEIHAVDGKGRDRMVARPSNEVELPPAGPSPVIDDRFARIPWDVALGQAIGTGHAGGPFPEKARAMLLRLSDWTRFTGATRGGSAGGMGGRPSSPAGPPYSPVRGPADPAEKPPGPESSG